MLSASVPINTPVFAQLASELDTSFTNANTLITSNADAAIKDRTFRRCSIQNCTKNFTIGDCGIPIVGCSDAAFTTHANQAAVAADTNQRIEIRNIILHVEAFQFKTKDYYDVMNTLVNSGKYQFHLKDIFYIMTL
jgi:hypothetical protein